MKTGIFNRKGGRLKRLCRSVMVIAALMLTAGGPAAAASGKPNFIVIVADDLGFSDLGSFGGEIRSPNLDRLAKEGLRFTNFYVAPSCSPTRSMLLTGLDNHVVGMGSMHEKTAPNQLEQPGYEGVLRADFRTIADVLRANGYHTYMAGKWHLGHNPKHIPSARGFERTFSILNGAGSHFHLTGVDTENKKSEFTADGKYLKRLPRGYYSTRTFTQKIIDFIEQARPDGRPFFAYLAYQAPHDPLQVPDSWLRKYKGAYDEGWDVIRENRLGRMKKLGIMPATAEISPRLWFVPEWDKLTGIAQVRAARRMEVYAAVVEYVDREVGRLLDYLEAKGLAENTTIIFFSDNGPNPHDPIQQAKKRAGALMSANFYATDYRTEFESWGRHNGYVSQGMAWAQVSSTPFNGFKLTTFDGGVRSPLIVWQKGRADAGRINTQDVLHVSDVAPTLLDLADIPKTALLPKDRPGLQTGRSWRPLFQGPEGAGLRRSSGLGMEIFGGRAYREGPWKITWMHKPFGTDDWQLFNLDDDPAERKDLSQKHPDLRARLIAGWEAYAEANNVIVPDRTIFDGLEENLPPRPPVDSPDWPRGQEPNWTTGHHMDEDD